MLEVLVALSLILGVWMTSVTAYHGLALRFKQQERKRSDLLQMVDAYELAEQVRANQSQSTLFNLSPLSPKGVRNESTRVSSRTRALHPAIKSATKNQY